jgi:hypothetical protein
VTSGRAIGFLMEELKRLEATNVPTLTKAWQHNGEILGISTDGELVVVARLVVDEKETVFKTAPSARKRAPGKKKETPEAKPEE